MKFISISAEIKVTIDVKIKVPPVPIFNWHPYWYLLLRFQNGRRFQWELRWPMVTIAVLTRAYSSWSRPFDHLDHVFIVLYRYLCSGQTAYIQWRMQERGVETCVAVLTSCVYSLMHIYKYTLSDQRVKWALDPVRKWLTPLTQLCFTTLATFSLCSWSHL